MATKRIGVLTSGGDCPGLNAVIYGVVQAATNRDWEVLGFNDGYEGLLPPVRYRILDRRSVAGIMHLGGTILGTTNRGHFVAKVDHGNKAQVPTSIIEQARETVEGLNLDALVCIGGDGSLTTALQLHESGFKVVGVPKTIDNDIEATAMTFGFDSAVASVVGALDRLHTTARSHKRVMVLETMGRYAGWIALYGGFAGGADVILIPEIPFDYEEVFKVVRERESYGSTSTMIVVAEGAFPKNGTYSTLAQSGEKAGEARLGGIAEQVAREIERATGKEARSVVLGHLQRGGHPTTIDRILGCRFGVGAIDLIAEGKFGHMVSYHNYQVGDVPIAKAVSRLKKVAVDGQFVRMAREIGICFGD